MSAGISELINAKKNHLETLRKLGIEPYPYYFNPKDFSKDLKDKYDKTLSPGEHTQINAVVAGRIMSIRSFGKLYFIVLQDYKGRIQVNVSEAETEPNSFNLIKYLDTGDFIGVEGNIVKTKKGELSILAKKVVLLAKSLNPLPEKWHGLTDIETRYRKRHLDLIMNPEIKEVFIKRAKIITFVRKFLETKGFLEVEIPLLQPNYGGANARPFITKSWAWKSDFYLSISPELYLKRLIIGGFDKVYTICKNFRNEDVDKTHNPEFTMMECYASYWDYNDVMALTEELFEKAAIEVNGTTKINYNGTEIDLKAPWPRMTMHEAIKKFANLDIEKMTDEEIKKVLTENNIEIEQYKRGLAIAEIFSHYCEKNLVQPHFIIDHPKETTPLCKPKRGNPELIERFEAFINTWEMANAYSELNDPELQERFFKEQAEQGRAKGENHPPDEDFVDALRYGMPPTGGLGIGIDRLVMLLTSQPTIKDVIFFPQMKPEKKTQTEAKENDTKLEELRKTQPNKTEMLFNTNPYLFETYATIRKISGKKVYLDKTIFFPFSGGQKSDTGTINTEKVLEVIIEDNDIAHVLASNNFKVGSKVKLTIDKEKRLKTMRLHSASHIVGHFVGKIKGSEELVGSLVDHEKDRSTFALKNKITNEELKKIEDLTNEFISKNYEILRYPDKINPNVLWWECNGIKMPCCGTHVKNTSEIGKIKLKRESKGEGKELVETYLAQ
ncbi:MAG: lysine--tRNA ligase [Candidatus Diapherotrites archaeon]